MGFLDKLFGADEGDKPKEKSDDGKADRPSPIAAPRAAEPPVVGKKGASVAGAEPPPEPAEFEAALGVSARAQREVRMLVNAAVRHVEQTAASFDQVLEGQKTLTGMIQAVAKAAARADQERKQQSLELRAHITSETDRLISSMREEAAREASVEVFRAVLPALDEVDHVLRENEAGAEVRAESIRILRRRLRDALSRMGIEEAPIERRATKFDAEVHEGRPYEGDPEAVRGLEAHVVVDVERNGWMGFGKVLRHALVTVVKE